VRAGEIAQAIIHSLRTKSYQDLVTGYLDAHVHSEVLGDSGTEYQVEIDAIWDGREGGNVRVVVAVDDGGWSAISPLIELWASSETGTPSHSGRTASRVVKGSARETLATIVSSEWSRACPPDSSRFSSPT
jgi:hypothetical protein